MERHVFLALTIAWAVAAAALLAAALLIRGLG
jgi:hypothetical protein